MAATTAVVVTVAVTTPWRWLPGAAVAPVDPTAGLPSDQLARITAYRAQVVPLGLASTAATLTLAVVLGLTPCGARLVRRMPAARWWWVQVIVAVLVVGVLTRVATLAFAIRTEQVQHAFGLSVQSWPGWVVDQLTGYAIGSVATSVLALLLVGLWRTLRRWWLPASLLAAILVVGASFAYPVVVEPLFAHFTPMPEGPLRTSLLELASRDGVTVDSVLVSDASARTTELNAYVSGFGSTKRIVVYDTLLDQATPDEVRLVVAHELGHAKNDDVLRGTLVGALGAVAGVTALAMLISSARIRRRAGYGGPRDAAVVPALLALVSLGSFLALPLQNGVSRAVEARADVHALDLTADPGTFVAAQRRLAVANLSSPSPPRVLYFWYASHPTVKQRIALAAVWQAESGSGAGRPSGGAGGADVAVRLDVVAGLVEGVLDEAAEGEDGEHDDGGDEGDQQAVLHGRRAGLGVATTAGDGADALKHGGPRSVVEMGD